MFGFSIELPPHREINYTYKFPVTTATDTSTCVCAYCGAIHQGRLCPRIAEIEYFENGTTKRVVLK